MIEYYFQTQPLCFYGCDLHSSVDLWHDILLCSSMQETNDSEKDNRGRGEERVRQL
jgi:hypothetical protein